MKKINIRDIAKETGLSIASVSRALNNLPGVSARTRQRVIETGRELGFNIRAGRQKTVAVILPGVRNSRLGDYSIQMLNALREAVLKRGDRAIFLSREDLSLLNETMVSGVISFDFQNEISKAFPLMKNIPLVICNDASRHFENVFGVYSNDGQGMELALRHLHGELNHTRIGFLYHQASAGNICSDRRVKGLEEAAARYGIGSTCFCRGWSQGMPLHEALGHLLQKKITALLVSGEGLENMALHALHLYGKRVPEDLSILSWESVHSISHIPRHTTLEQDFRRLADASLELLDKSIRGDQDIRDILIDYKLNIRESTARCGSIA
ncbi:MAG: LacI family DNA-binding transcriptional regulator [Lentisphaeria bacterium]|nr:LacI family DNA-binding transcriptional regulator [Lentisphaeria bacterium]